MWDAVVGVVASCGGRHRGLAGGGLVRAGLARRVVRRVGELAHPALRARVARERKPRAFLTLLWHAVGDRIAVAAVQRRHRSAHLVRLCFQRAALARAVARLVRIFTLRARGA